MSIVKNVVLAAAAVLSLLAATACSSTDNSSTSTSSLLANAPSSPLVSEPFSGTVQQGGNDFHQFTVISDGFQISLALTTAGPPATIQEGFGVGQVVAGSCQLLSGGFGTYAASTTTPQLSGTIPAGSYCVMVYDVGNQTGPITYTVVVQHY